MFSQKLLQELSPLHLLKHPFYQAWSAGELELPMLQEYAKQYFAHVNAFPRYVSAIHSLCVDETARPELARNLADEEGLTGTPSHPTLWRQFAHALGVTDSELETSTLQKATRELVDGFCQKTRSSYAEGLGALLAYEYQVPEIAATKIEGLKKFYNLTSAEAIEFFVVHQEADVHHSRSLREAVDRLPQAEQEQARASALQSGQLLWNFLSETYAVPCTVPTAAPSAEPASA